MQLIDVVSGLNHSVPVPALGFVSQQGRFLTMKEFGTWYAAYDPTDMSTPKFNYSIPPALIFNNTIDVHVDVLAGCLLARHGATAEEQLELGIRARLVTESMKSLVGRDVPDSDETTGWSKWVIVSATPSLGDIPDRAPTAPSSSCHE